jgi:NADH-quinone oxidoreductase subunit M
MLLWKDKIIARQYFIIQFIGSSFLLCVILIAINQGYPELGPISETWLQNLFIFGLGIKSAIFGLHFWLAPIHSMAPAPVSAILSGWVVKLGFITYLKIIPEGNNLLLYLGFLMIFYGGIKALLATDYKVLLAFSSISQLGFIALAIASGTIYGYLGAVFHIIAHGLAKTTLFIGSGYWLKEYGTRSIYKFRSAWKRQKLNSLTTLISFSSLMGLPLLAGYNSKYLIKHGFEGELVLTVLLSAASIMTVLYAARFLRWGLLDFNKNDNTVNNGKSNNYLLAINEKFSILPPVILLIFLGTFPFLLINLLDNNVYHFHLLTGIKNIIFYLLIGGALLYKLEWIKVAEKTPPSLNKYFKQSYKLIYALSIKSKEFDADVFFETFLYQKLYNFSRWLYNKVFINFQLQLLWIPLFILLLLVWKFI